MVVRQFAACGGRRPRCFPPVAAHVRGPCFSRRKYVTCRQYRENYREWVQNLLLKSPSRAGSVAGST